MRVILTFGKQHSPTAPTECSGALMGGIWGLSIVDPHFGFVFTGFLCLNDHHVVA